MAGKVWYQVFFFIESSSLWENGYYGSFYGKLRAELLNVEIFNCLKEAEILI